MLKIESSNFHNDDKMLYVTGDDASPFKKQMEYKFLLAFIGSMWVPVINQVLSQRSRVAQGSVVPNKSSFQVPR
jgi:hypothetical protein